MTTSQLISSAELAELAGTTQRAVKKALQAIIEGKRSTWRGAHLIIHTVPGRGGRSGVQYRVEVSSLPAALQLRWRERHAAELGVIALRADADANARRNFKWHVLASALKHRAGSRERGAAIREITGRTHLFPGETTPRRISPETVHRWLRHLEKAGHAALQKAVRRDRGQHHSIIGRRWDKRTATLGEVVQADIAEQLKPYVRGLIKAGEKTAGVPLQMLTSQKLAELTSQAGYRGRDLRSICEVPRTFLERERVYARVHEFRTDRKSYMDRAAPRVLRSRAGLTPMDIIVGDIHPVDILVRREDGSVATFRAIAWLDVATNRIWLDLHLPPKGEAVRNEHVIASFRRMVAAWGAPRVLYLDNGSEYNWAPFIDDALQLIDRASGRRLIGEIGGGDRASQIIRALPYNASAKPIEGIFSILEQNHFCQIQPGWIGGDRLRKKSANVGQEPEPFAGSTDECAALMLRLVEGYHRLPQRGALNGRSPYSALADAIAAGWTMTAVDDEAFAVAFSTEERRIVQQGRIRHAGGFWTCPEIVAYQHAAVMVRVPKYEGWSRLPVFGEDGQLLGFAEREAGYGFLDQAGAQEAHRRRRANKAAVIALDRSAPDVDPVGERLNWLRQQLPAPVAPVAATIGASDQAKTIAAGLRETPEQRADRRQQEIDDTQRELLRLAAKRRRIANGGK